MASLTWSSTLGGTTHAFDPANDVFTIDEGIAAADVRIESEDLSTVSFTVGDKTITLETSPYSLTTTAIVFEDGSQLIIGDNSTDIPSMVGGADHDPQTINGGAGDDQLIGAGGADVISGGDGHDIFFIVGDQDGVYGNDTLDGGAGGFDRVVYGDAETGIVANIGNETAQGSISGGDSGSTITLDDIDEVTGTEFDDVFNANSETQVNGRITDIVQRFEGGAGNDTLNGAEGDGRITIIEFTGAAGPVAINLAEGTAADGEGGTDTFTNVDGVVGSAHDDEIIGGSDSRSRTGALIENFEGMAGNDTIDGLDDQDEARYAFSPEGINVNLGTGLAEDGWGTQDVLLNIERVRGSEFNDAIVGNSGNNIIEGLGGDDILNGAGGFDRVRYSRSTDGVAVNLGSGEINLADYGLDDESIAGGTGQSIGVGDDAGVGVDTLTSFEGVQGSDFDDVLVGGANGLGFGSRQEFEGGAGNDILDGGDADPASFDLAAFTADPSGVYVNLSANDIDLGDSTILAGTARDGYGVNGQEAGTDTLLNLNGARGSAFADTIIGGDGDEWFNGNLGSDFIDAGDGNDTIQGSGGGDTTWGGLGDDSFVGDNSIQVNGRRDDSWQTFEGGAGDDTVQGATGDGRITAVDYRNSSSGVVVNLGTGTASDGEGGTDTFITTGGANIDRVFGSMHNDILTGGGEARSIGGGGNEGFEGMAGHDTMDGGSRADLAMYDYSPGSVIVNLSDQQAVVGGLTVDGGTARDGWNDELNEADGAAGYVDKLISINVVVGSGLDDTFIGGAGEEQFEGQEGNDSIDGGEGFDRVRYFRATGAVAVNLGSEDVNLADYGLAAQTVTGGTAAGIGGDNGVGTDTFVNIEGARGSDFDDVLVGGGVGLGEESFFAEVLEGGAGNDTLDGGDADASSLDYASYERSLSGVIVNLGSEEVVVGDQTIAGGTALDGYDVNGHEEGTDTLVNINAVRGSRHDDTLVGGDGDETFEGSGGNDSIVGGEGSDTADYAGANGSVVVNLFGTSTISPFGQAVAANSARDGQGGVDTLSSIENAIGGEFDDFLQGGSNANLLDGGGGNDTISASGMTDTGAADTLLGGAGNDVIRQSRGHDVIDGGEGASDRLEFNTSGMAYGSDSASVHVDLGQEFSNFDRTGFDTMSGEGTEADIASVQGIEIVFGTAGNDWLVGGSLARSASDSFLETYRGNGGNDTIDGAGESENKGRGFNDQIEYNNATGAVSVNLTAGVAQGIGGDNGVGVDTLIDINWVRGSSFNDVLIGSDNSGTGRMERFEGRAGSDTINGGAGQDEASYIQSQAGVNVNLQTGLGSDGWGGTDTLLNIERIRGSDFNDTLTGSNNTTVIERFSGEEGNDVINGGAGIDFASWSPTEVEEGGVNVFIENGSGTVNDGFGGIDTLINIEGLEGSSSGDSLAGGAGGQWFRGRGGSDTLDGGANVDTADYSVDHLEVIVNLGASDVIVDVGNGDETVAGGTARDGFGGVYDLQGTDTLISIENVLGSSAGDHITGSAGTNLLDGNTGDDTMDGGAGNDTLLGGEGNDSLSGGAGNDTLDGGAGDDVLAGDADADVFADKTGDDSLLGGEGDDAFLVNYTTGTIEASGEGGSDTYVLSPDATGSTYRVLDFDNVGTGLNRDYIDVGALLDASAQAGFYTGQAVTGFLRFVDQGDDKVLQWNLNGAGDDWVTMITLAGLGGQAVTTSSFKGFIQGTGGKDTKTGTSGDDLMLGLAGNDKLTGGAGSDQLFGGDGADTMTGGSGADSYEVDNAGDKVVETTNAGGLELPGGGEGTAGVGGIGDTVIAAINYTLGSFVENLVLTGNASRANGNTLNNHIVGNAGNDTLTGSSGNDTLNGGTGSDSLVGGTGNDLYVVDAATGDKVLEVATGGGIDTMHSSVTRTLDANVEHLVLLDGGLINGTGNALANSMTGNGVKNILTGAAGNDTLDGGGGNDDLRGDAGNDLYIMDAAGDFVSKEAAGAAGGTDTVRSTATQTLDANVENLVLLGNLAIDGTGNTLANRITGNATDNVLHGGAGSGKDTLEGGGGNDTLIGGAGVDSMIGGAGDDVYNVDVGTDKVVESANNGGNHDTVQSTATAYTLAANVENLHLLGVGNINGTGNGGNNNVTGNDGINILDGGIGNDSLDGGLGADTLIGGAGFDVLVWDGNDTGAGALQGGADYDIVRLLGEEITIDLAQINDDVITGIEEFDLTGSGNNSLTLTHDDILALGGDGSTLWVNGDAGDSVDAGSNWAQLTDLDLGGTIFHVYQQGGAMLHVNAALTLTIGLD